MNRPAPHPQTEPQAFLRHLFDIAVARAQPAHGLPPHLPPPPRGRTLVLGAGDFALTLGGFTIGGIGTATFGAILLNALLSRRMAAAPQGEVVRQES